jgi:hypothetical protein
VDSPPTRQEFCRLRLDLWVDPRVLVVAGFVVSIRDTNIVREGKSEDRQHQISGGDREVSAHLLRSSQQLGQLR